MRDYTDVWGRFQRRVIIKAELVTVTGLRIGAGGESYLPSATDLPILKQNGVPYIPGSSLRGPLRAEVERLVRTVEPGPTGGGYGACDPLYDRACGGRDAAKAAGQSLDPESVWNSSCRVCRIFGSQRLASRLRVRDLPLIDRTGGKGPWFDLRDGVAIDREKETAASGLKFDFEVVVPGQAFALEMVGENLADDELGLVAYALKELHEQRLPIGGFKGRGLGRVRLDSLSVQVIDGIRDLKQFSRTNGASPAPLRDDQAWAMLERWINSFWEQVGEPAGKAAGGAMQ
ncbi:MAG: CRISPR-associated RAMP protein [Limnochordales bacterium]|nr:CRISPR-associated RAMP protein [Limnochordales bacterium]